MNERDAFLKALTENEDDTTTRLVYADWLDECGEHEEADRQRKSPAAKEWLARFFRDYSGGDYMGQLSSCEQLIEIGRTAVAKAEELGFEFDCGANEKMKDSLQANNHEFWKNWSVVTGIPLSPDVEEKIYFVCGC